MTDPAGPKPQPTRAEKRAQWWAETKVDLKWATALLFVLILALSGYLWTRWEGPTTGEENLEDVTDQIFSQGAYADNGTAGSVAMAPGLVAPFEILSVLLLAAMIAGIAIAFRDREDEA